jgi:mRNA-degrading endonuclease RelE of RelBE toxin-antitoxin system
VIDAVKHLAQTGEGDVVRLADVEPAEYRLRVGDWRIRFTRDDENRRLQVLRVLHRGKAYR